MSGWSQSFKVEYQVLLSLGPEKMMPDLESDDADRLVPMQVVSFRRVERRGCEMNRGSPIPMNQVGARSSTIPNPRGRVVRLWGRESQG